MSRLSRQEVGNLHWLVDEKLRIVLDHMEDICKAGKAIDVFAAWRSMTLDIISTFAFGTCLNSLDDVNFNHTMLHVLEVFLRSFYLVSTAHPRS